MEVPILKQGPFLIVSIQSALNDKDLFKLQNDLMGEVVRYHSDGVIIDITALDVLDSFATRTLQNMAQMIGLLGAKAILVGMQADVALAMVQLHLTLKDVETALDLEEGIELLNNYLKREQK